MSKQRKQKLVLPYHLQFFADGEGGTAGEGATGSDIQNLDNLLNTMGQSNVPPEGEQTDPPEGEQTEQPGDTTPPAQQKPKDNQQAHAFAQMRTQNAQLRDLVGKIAKANGIEFKDDSELFNKLNDDAINKLAKNDNVSPELLKRMEMLERNNTLFEASKRKDTAIAGFNSLRSTYGLSDEELQSFARELDEKGKNPFLLDVDLETEYKLTHFNDVVSKKVQAEVEAALKRSKAADQHSSTPNSVQGRQDSGTPEKISTVAGLNTLLSDMK